MPNSSDYYEILVKFPRVTKILQALPKNLEWWGYKLGIQAALELAVKGQLPEVGEELDVEVVEPTYELAKKLGREQEVTTPYNSLQKAGGRGTDIHKIAESFFQKGKIPSPKDVPEEYHGYVKALAGWWRIWSTVHGAEIFCAEETVYSLTHRYAGTLDLILKMGDSYSIIDFKTSKGIYESHLLQVAAYQEAACEMGVIPLGSRVSARVVRLGVDGVFEEQVSACTIEDFVKVKEVWTLLERLKGGGNAGIHFQPAKHDNGGNPAPRLSVVSRSGGGDSLPPQATSD